MKFQIVLMIVLVAFVSSNNMFDTAMGLDDERMLKGGRMKRRKCRKLIAETCENVPCFLQDDPETCRDELETCIVQNLNDLALSEDCTMEQLNKLLCALNCSCDTREARKTCRQTCTDYTNPPQCDDDTPSRLLKRGGRPIGRKFKKNMECFKAIKETECTSCRGEEDKVTCREEKATCIISNIASLQPTCSDELLNKLLCGLKCSCETREARKTCREACTDYNNPPACT